VRTARCQGRGEHIQAKEARGKLETRTKLGNGHKKEKINESWGKELKMKKKQVEKKKTKIGNT